MHIKTKSMFLPVEQMASQIKVYYCSADLIFLSARLHSLSLVQPIYVVPFSFNHFKQTIMKRIILAVCLFASVGSFANPKENLSTYAVKSDDGQHIPASQVPAPVMKDFNARYPNARNTSWEVESEHGKLVYRA